MFHPQKSNKFIFWRNCLILYVFVGCFASLIADFNQDFQLSHQSANANKFSRIISLNVAYSFKQNLSK